MDVKRSIVTPRIPPAERAHDVAFDIGVRWTDEAQASGRASDVATTLPLSSIEIRLITATAWIEHNTDTYGLWLAPVLRRTAPALALHRWTLARAVRTEDAAITGLGA